MSIHDLDALSTTPRKEHARYQGPTRIFDVFVVHEADVRYGNGLASVCVEVLLREQLLSLLVHVKVFGANGPLIQIVTYLLDALVVESSLLLVLYLQVLVVLPPLRTGCSHPLAHEDGIVVVSDLVCVKQPFRVAGLLR